MRNVEDTPVGALLGVVSLLLAVETFDRWLVRAFGGEVSDLLADTTLASEGTRHARVGAVCLVVAVEC